MRKPTYYETQKEVLERKKALLKDFRVSKTASSAERDRLVSASADAATKANCARTEVVVEPTEAQLGVARQIPSWKKICSGTAGLQFSPRAEATQGLKAQPWTHGLVNTLLDAATEGGVHICLVWPARLDSVALLHGIASLERNFSRDLRGMRTLLFPGTNDTRNALQHVLVNREQLSDLFRSLWISTGDIHEIKSHTRSASFEAMLSALNDIRTYHPEVENPSLGELVPSLLCRRASQGWASVSTFPLERSLKKVEKLAQRRDIRSKVNAEWGDPEKAPGALMVMHYTARKDTWKDALRVSGFRSEGKPEVFLLDATSRAEKTDYNAVRRIPDFLRYAVDNGFEDVGSVVIADDPKTFFVLRARLHELKFKPVTKVWAAEGDEGILSTNPLPADWKPEQRSNANFNVGIVDRDASQVALAFQKLARETGNEESASYQAVLAACLYILRLSNMPAGYKDLTAESASIGGEDFGDQRNSWTTVKLGFQAVLQSGALNTRRTDAEKAIAKADQLIDAWTDATPMAGKLLAEVQTHAIEGQEGLSVVLPSKKYIQLAHRFLQRKLGERWASAEAKLDWHTLSSVNKTLTGERKGRNFIFVGINRSVLRLLVTHPDIPHGTTVLISYKQADSMLNTLTNMKELEAFKAYRGRLGLLAQQIERRLKDVPNPLLIGKLGEMRMTFALEDGNRSGAADEQLYYKFELEGGGNAYASSRVYRYKPDEDPFFQPAAASSIREGDFIFEMSDELRSELESVLEINNDGLGSVIYPERALLRLYHDDVKSRCELFFKATTRRTLAREIHAKMIEIDSSVSACRLSRVYYWLALQAEGDTRPHAPKDAKFFKVFCRALQIGDEEALKYWNFIRNARRLNQNLGRELSARYAEILFQPESASIYRRVPEAAIGRLQQEALHCVYRVERVLPPQGKSTA